jgi:hypothetical protein
VPRRKTCVDCSAPISQPSGRGRPRLRCSECAWLAAKQQKREWLMRLQGVSAGEAKEAAEWYYGPPSRDR